MRIFEPPSPDSPRFANVVLGSGFPDEKVSRDVGEEMVVVFELNAD
jgi:hypothetical protein